jgi:hypothetical protein
MTIEEKQAEQVQRLTLTADLALLQRKCDAADNARKQLQAYHNANYREMPAWLDAKSRGSIIRIVARVDSCRRGA